MQLAGIRINQYVIQIIRKYTSMKKILYPTIALSFVLLFGMQAMAQKLKEPAVWYPFDNYSSGYSMGYFNKDTQKHIDDAGAKSLYLAGSNISLVNDRFDHVMAAASFEASNNTVACLQSNNNYTLLDLYKNRLFGFNSDASPLPENFTISCWVYYNIQNNDSYRKIFYMDQGSKSTFGLVTLGSDIYLRRAAGANNQTFDYLFGAPASFDAGTGWYHLILTMGKREIDNAKYCKLYVGKPKRVKYSQMPPLIDSNNGFGDDPLATDFGGAYAFLGIQDFMANGGYNWGIGNAVSGDQMNIWEYAPKQGNTYPVLRIDDFAVWGNTFTDRMARRLFACQNNPSWTWQGCVEQEPSNTALKDSVVNKISTKETSVLPMGMLTDIIVFPNPTSGQTWIKLPGVKAGTSVTCILTDLNGKTILLTKKVVVKQAYRIDLGNIKSITKIPGVYLLQIISPQQKKITKLIVQ